MQAQSAKAFKPRKPRPCRVCKVPFVRSRQIQATCGYECEVTHAMALLEKKQRKELAADKRKTRERLKELRPLGYWMKQAQRAFNAWCRHRDRDLPCISCGATKGAFDAGHYRSVGSCPELRFDEANVNKQCAMNCNHHKGGNVLEYRKGLIAKIGVAAVERLEGPHPPKHYRAEDLRAITAEYRARLKAALAAST